MVSWAQHYLEGDFDLQIGQTLSFHSSAFNEATLRVAGRDAFRGSIGKINDQWAFKVESKSNEDM